MTAYLESTQKFIDYHEKHKTDRLRIGQRFYIIYLNRPWPELFYADYDIAVMMINDWLTFTHYRYDLPIPLRDLGATHAQENS